MSKNKRSSRSMAVAKPKVKTSTIYLFLHIFQLIINKHERCFRSSLAVLVYEEDIGVFTIKVATDPRACNRVVIYRPAANLISQLELISLWEKKTGRSLNKVHVPEEEMVTLSESLPDPENIPISILHSVFVKGVTANFEVGEDDVEASALYPDLKVTTIDELLNIFLCNPPKPVSAAFE
ncbi:UNVERIFIED_CONTAM: Eugenol synthase 1 [Sesamum radiatum]|uniref:Eugenol synthase 1 n=1 Tax=Sesamum radiatum TaxID=300843 RepID=A0AAW2PX14_SESRA